MEAKFVVRAALDRSACLAMARHQLKWLKLAFWAVDAVMLALAVTLTRSGSPHAGIVSVFCVLLIIYSLALDYIAGWMMFKSVNKAIGVTEYTFGADSVRAVNRQEDTALGYNTFVKLDETDRRFFLYLRKNTALVLSKAGFTTGKPEDFAAFLAAKCGKEVKRSKY